MLKKLLVRLLLGWRKKGVFDLVWLAGKPYLIKIHLYEPAEEIISKMEKALQRQGLEV